MAHSQLKRIHNLMFVGADHWQLNELSVCSVRCFSLSEVFSPPPPSLVFAKIGGHQSLWGEGDDRRSGSVTHTEQKAKALLSAGLTFHNETQEDSPSGLGWQTEFSGGISATAEDSDGLLDPCWLGLWLCALLPSVTTHIDKMGHADMDTTFSICPSLPALLYF